MNSHTVVRCSCGHYDELISIYGKPSAEEVAAIRRQPCMRCQRAKLDGDTIAKLAKESTDYNACPYCGHSPCSRTHADCLSI